MDEADDLLKEAIEDAAATAEDHSLAAAGGPFYACVLVASEDYIMGEWEDIACNLGKRLQWSDANPNAPVLTVHMGAVIDRKFSVEKTGAVEVECLAFGCPTPELQQQVVDRLKRFSIYRVIAVEAMVDNPRKKPYGLMDMGFLTPKCLFLVQDVGDEHVVQSVKGFKVAFPTSTVDYDLLHVVDAPVGLEILERNLKELNLHWNE